MPSNYIKHIDSFMITIRFFFSYFSCSIQRISGFAQQSNGSVLLGTKRERLVSQLFLCSFGLVLVFK